MKKYYSIDKIIQKSNHQLDHDDLKDLCVRGQLTPCIYFEGNIVCIHDNREKNEIDARELGLHGRSISWSSIFKGYIHSAEFINTINTPADQAIKNPIFFNVHKIIEYIDPTSEFQSLAQDEYLKSFPRMTDDDIRNIRWLVEDKHFGGNPFTLTEIVFHHTEVDALFSAQIQKEDEIKFFNEYETLSLSDRLEMMRTQIKKLEREKEEYLKKIERLELEIDIKNEDNLKLQLSETIKILQAEKLQQKAPPPELENGNMQFSQEENAKNKSEINLANSDLILISALMKMLSNEKRIYSQSKVLEIIEDSHLDITGLSKSRTEKVMAKANKQYKSLIKERIK